ncbi:MAG: hypothetical protein JNM17_00780 [Archangium sp.]|nr:hypothetical protein [Archangium sp.]
MRLTIFGAALAFVAFTATTAHASCPTPTLTQCVDATYRAGSCFPTHQTHCTNLINSDWNTQVSALPQRYRVMPSELGSGIRRVGVQPGLLPTGTNTSGHLTLVDGLVSANQVLYRKNFANLGPDELAHAAALNAWAQNGTTITSCREYVHEKYLDYATFEAKAGKHGYDARAIFNDAYASNGIAYKKLYSKSGTELARIFDGVKKAEKNAYFRFVPGPYPAGQQPYTFSQTALKANSAQGRQFFTPTDAWHAQMSQTLANVNDDVLDDSNRRQQTFGDLLAARESAWKSYQSFNGAKFRPKTLEATTAAELRAIDQRIDAALVAAHAEGCLNLNQITACDWSPRRYYDMVRRELDARRQPDLTACVRLTGGDFSPTSFIRNADKLKLKNLPLKDYTLSAELVGAYLVAYGGAMDASDVPVDPATGVTRREGRYDDGGESGSRDGFGGAVSYGGGWSAEWGSSFCEAEVAIDGYGAASVWIFGEGGEIAAVSGGIRTDDENVVLNIDVRVFGGEVYTHEWNEEAELDFQIADIRLPDTRIEAKSTFIIVFVPVSIAGGIEVGLGIQFNLGGQVWRDCSINAVGIDLTGTARPYVSLGATASVAIGFPGLAAGLRGRVNIATVSLPLRGSVGVYTDGVDVFLRLGLSFGIQQRYLDGRISLFAELGWCPGPFCLTAEFTLVSWTGFGGPEVVLYDDHFDTRLASL